MQGEKHLIFLTPRGLPQYVPSSLESQTAAPREDYRQIAAAASDARVAIHVIQTGGIPSSEGTILMDVPVLPLPRTLVRGMTYFGMLGVYGAPGSGSGGGAPSAGQSTPGWDRPGPDPVAAIPGLGGLDVKAIQELRELADLTGGDASIMGYTADAADRIDSGTRADYLLAYSPSNAIVDGRYRAVKVKVTRPGVRVLSRQGYYAAERVDSLNRRTVVADGRLLAALSSTRVQRDIRVSATSAYSPLRAGKGGEAVVHLAIDISRLAWTTDELSRRVAHLDVGILCGDAKEKVVGQTRRTLDIAVTEERFLQIEKDALRYSISIPVAARPAFFKVVVYSNEANLVGSTVTVLK